MLPMTPKDFGGYPNFGQTKNLVRAEFVFSNQSYKSDDLDIKTRVLLVNQFISDKSEHKVEVNPKESTLVPIYGLSNDPMFTSARNWFENITQLTLGRDFKPLNIQISLANGTSGELSSKW